METEATLSRAASDIAGLDDILRGGFPRNYVHLLSGLPGTGKTTLALQFLRAGVARGERCLYVTLSETRSEVEAAARTHGWDLAGIEIAELAPSEHKLSADSQLTVFNPSELEIGETTEALIAAAERAKPQRLVIDSLSELRRVSLNALLYRRQIHALKQRFSESGCTTLFIDDLTGGIDGDHLQTNVHGVVLLEQLANQFS